MVITLDDNQINYLKEEKLKPKDNLLKSTLCKIKSNPSITIEENTIIDCNDLAVKVFGYECKEDLIGLHPSQLSPEIQPDGMSSFEKSHQLLQKAFENNNVSFQWVHKRKNGEEFLAKISIILVHKEKKIYIILINDITERNKIILEMEENQSKFKSFFEQNDAVMAIVNPRTWEIVDANLAACSYYGYSKEKLTTLKLTDINTQSNERIKEKLEKAVDGKQKSFSSKHRLADKTIRNVEVYTALIKFNKEIFLHIIIHDVTEKEQITRVLREREKQYNQLFESMLCGYALHEGIYDDSGKLSSYRYIDVNSAFEMYMGLKREEVIGKTVHELFPNDEDFWMDIYDRVLTTGESVYFERYIPYFNKCYAVNVYTSKENTFACSFIDITKRKKAEKELKKSELRFRTIFNNASFGIAVGNKYGEFIEVNEKLVEITGYTKEELLKKTVTDLAHSDDEKYDWDALKTVAASNEGFYKYQKRYVRKDAGVFWADVSITSIFDEDSNDELILGIVLDITDKKIEEEAIKRSEIRFRNIVNMVASEISHLQKEEDYSLKSQYGLFQLNNNSNNKDIKSIRYKESKKDRILHKLEKINIELENMFKKEVEENKKKEAFMIYHSRLAAMGQMIGNIAHQWRQPLNNLALILSNLQDDYKYSELSGEELEDSINKSKKIIKKMSQTIDDFRFFFKPYRNKKVFSIYKNILFTLDLMEENFKFNKIETSIDLVEDSEVYGYSSQYSQVIFNIINNSKDVFLERNIETKKIRIKIYRQNNMAVVEIRDNGGGIEEDILEKIFDPYFTTKSEGKGTGIGLYMSKTIIEKNMHGKIEFFNIDHLHGKIKFSNINHLHGKIEFFNINHLHEKIECTNFNNVYREIEKGVSAKVSIPIERGEKNELTKPK